MAGLSSPLGTRKEKTKWGPAFGVAEVTALVYLEGAFQSLSGCGSFEKSQRSSFNNDVLYPNH